MRISNFYRGPQQSTSGYNDSPIHYRYHPSTPPHLPGDLRRTSLESPTDSYDENYEVAPMPQIILSQVCNDVTSERSFYSLQGDSEPDTDSVFNDRNEYHDIIDENQRSVSGFSVYSASGGNLNTTFGNFQDKENLKTIQGDEQNCGTPENEKKTISSSDPEERPVMFRENIFSSGPEDQSAVPFECISPSDAPAVKTEVLNETDQSLVLQEKKPMTLATSNSTSGSPGERPVVFASESSSVSSENSFQTQKNKKMKYKRIRKDSLPPTYDAVLKQVLEEFYITDEAFVIEDMKNSIGAQLRARAAREKFQNMCTFSSDLGCDLGTRRNATRSSSRRKYIIPGTVKKRKEIFLNMNSSSFPFHEEYSGGSCNFDDESDYMKDESSISQYTLNLNPEQVVEQKNNDQNESNSYVFNEDFSKNENLRKSEIIDMPEYLVLPQDGVISESYKVQCPEENSMEDQSNIFDMNSFEEVESTAYLLPQYTSSMMDSTRSPRDYDNNMRSPLISQDSESLENELVSPSYDLLSESSADVDSLPCNLEKGKNNFQSNNHDGDSENDTNQSNLDVETADSTTRSQIRSVEFEETL